MASSRKLYWVWLVSKCVHLHVGVESAYSFHLEVSEDTTRATTQDASVADLGRPCVVAHLGQLQLGFGADSGRECRVSDNVTEGLPV